MSYLTELLKEYAVMGGRRGDDPALDSDDMFEFDLNSDPCSCSDCGKDCSCEETNCSECGIQFEDDEMGMDGGAEDNGMRRRDGDMDGAEDNGMRRRDGDMDGAEDNGMRRRDDDETDIDMDMEPGGDDLDMEPGDDMGGDVESRLDDLESKLNDVLQKFAQVIAQDMTNDMEPGDDDLGMDADTGDDDLGMGADTGDDDLGMDADTGDDDLGMDAGPEKEGTGEFDMDAFDDEFELTDDEVVSDEPAGRSGINPEIRKKIDRMKDEKELKRLLMSGKMPKKMSFKAARKFMQEYEDDLPDTVNQDDHDNEVDGKFKTDTYGNRDGKKRLNKRYRKHRVAETAAKR